MIELKVLYKILQNPLLGLDISLPLENLDMNVDLNLYHHVTHFVCIL